MTRAEQLTDRITFHGEGAVWFPADDAGPGRLHIVDMLEGAVLTLTPDGRLLDRTGDGSRVAACVRPRTDGGVVVADQTGFLLADADPDRPSRFGGFRRLAAALDDDSLRLNEGNADPSGVFWCGSMAWDKSPGRGELFRVALDGAVTTVLTDVTISNGLGWSPDGSLAYYNDTPTHRVDVFDWAPGRGLSGRRPFAHIDPDDGNPDGLTVDAEGGVWVALYGGGAVRRYDPDGSVSAEVEIPGARQVTSVAVGGPSMDQLFVTTSRENLSEDEQPVAGCVFTAAAGVRGMAPLPFSG